MIFIAGYIFLHTTKALRNKHEKIEHKGEPFLTTHLTQLDPGFLRYCPPLVSQLLDPKNYKTQFSQTDMARYGSCYSHWANGAGNGVISIGQ